MQIRILDFMAISMGIVAGVRPAALLLQPGRPPRSLCTPKNYILVCETIFISCFIVFGCVRLLVSQPWYTGGNGQHDHVSTCICVSFSTLCSVPCMICMAAGHVSVQASIVLLQCRCQLVIHRNLHNEAAPLHLRVFRVCCCWSSLGPSCCNANTTRNMPAQHHQSDSALFSPHCMSFRNRCCW